MSKRFTSRLLCLSTLGGLISVAAADLIATNWDDANTYGYLTLYMPDLDQERQGDLPNNGLCHCGPALCSMAWTTGWTGWSTVRSKTSLRAASAV